MKFPYLHPLCILLIEDLNETALASRLRYAYYASCSLFSSSSLYHCDILICEASALDLSPPVQKTVLCMKYVVGRTSIHGLHLHEYEIK